MKYFVNVTWKKSPAELFTDNMYSRSHQWTFDGGTTVIASSSPQVVPLPMSDESAIDPEEAFIASIASCHMLFFLSLAAGKKYIIQAYEDHTEGMMSKNEDGKTAITAVTLKPKVHFSGPNIPSYQEIATLHELAHQKCYLANSIKSTIHIIQS